MLCPSRDHDNPNQQRALDNMPHPDRDDARQIGKKYDEDQIVVIYVDRDDGTFGYASYGATSALCDKTKELADHLFEKAREWLTQRAA